jgi:hypothetical protein
MRGALPEFLLSSLMAGTTPHPRFKADVLYAKSFNINCKNMTIFLTYCDCTSRMN